RRHAPLASLPLTPRFRPTTTEPSIDSLAHAARLPLFAVRTLNDEATIAMLGELRPDLIVVACFPKLLPGRLLARARHGGINLHPSLLPALRGPDPLFWTFRQALSETGVTLHELTDQFDAGPIVARARRDVPDGIRAPDLEHDLAVKGADLLLEVITSL